MKPVRDARGALPRGGSRAEPACREAEIRPRRDGRFRLKAGTFSNTAFRRVRMTQAVGELDDPIP